MVYTGTWRWPRERRDDYSIHCDDGGRHGRWWSRGDYLPVSSCTVLYGNLVSCGKYSSQSNVSFIYSQLYECRIIILRSLLNMSVQFYAHTHNQNENLFFVN